MLTYSFTDISATPLYAHLYGCIKNDILSGALKAGMQLPSKRSLAKNLNISAITVETAYEQLQSEGFIYSRPRQGFYVADLSEHMHHAVSAQNAKKETGHIKARPQAEYRVDLVSNQADAASFPFSVWAKLMRQTLSEGGSALLEKPPSGGVPALREAISRHLKQFRNMTVDPVQVIVGAGTEYLYGLIIQLLGYERIYAVETPGYTKIAHIYESNQVAYHPVAMDDGGVSMAALEASTATVAHVSPTHHFPTGRVTTVGRRYELLGWANQDAGRYIIEDDYDSEFRLTGKPIPTLQSIDVSGKVIYMNTFSKSLASTIRISYMVLPMPLVERFYEKLGFYACTVSNFEQHTLARFISERYFEKHINRMRTHYRCLRDALLKEIRTSPLAAHCQITEEDAGLHFLLQVKTELSDGALVKRAKEVGLHISALSEYALQESDPPPAGCLVINYSSLKEEDIPTAVALLVRCIRPEAG